WSFHNGSAIPAQVLKAPSAKSFRTALTSCEERVSSRKLDRHSLARFSSLRSMAPSKKSGEGMVHGGAVQVILLSLFLYCQATEIAPIAALSFVAPVPAFTAVLVMSQSVPLGNGVL